MDCLAGCWHAPPILHLLQINAGVKVQSIIWCAWLPPGRSLTLKISCELNIDDIRGNTKFVANCLYFLENSITIDSLKFFLGWCSMLQLSTENFLLKSDTERGKYARFSILVPFLACLLPRLNGLLSRVLTGTPYSVFTMNKCRS